MAVYLSFKRSNDIVVRTKRSAEHCIVILDYWWWLWNQSPTNIFIRERFYELYGRKWKRTDLFLFGSHSCGNSKRLEFMIVEFKQYLYV